MTRLAVVALVATLLVLAGGSAQGNPTTTTSIPLPKGTSSPTVTPLSPSNLGAAVTNSGANVSPRPKAPSGRNGKGSGASPVVDTEPQYFMVDTEIRLRPDGTQCAYLFNVPGLADSAQGRANQQEAVQALTFYQACPDSPIDAAGGTTPAGAAEHVWQELVELPTPSLWIAPGEAITGLPAYLEIGGEPALSVVFGPDQALGYTITMDIRSTYDVDWGDGTVFAGITSQGGPYPHGDVGHNYQHVDPDNVVEVTQRWTATWSAVGASGTTSGTIAGELFTSEAFPLPVGQIQAVRNY